MSLTSLNKNIFRKNAIDNLSSVESMQTFLRVIHPHEYLWIMFAIFLLFSVLTWFFFGNVTQSIDAQGIVFSSDKVDKIEKNINQIYKDHHEKIMILKDLLLKKEMLYKNHYLTIDSLLKAKEDYISAKEELSDSNKSYSFPVAFSSSDSSENSSNTLLEALVFVDHVQGKKIAQGMDVYVLPGTVSQYDYGYIIGKVISVSEYPVSKQLAYSYISNMNLVDDFFVNGAPFIVKIILKRNPLTKSGLAWTTRNGSNFSLQPGAMISAKIVYKKCSPFRLISKT